MEETSAQAYTVLAVKPQGRKPNWRPNCKWKINIEINLRKVGYKDMKWTERKPATDAV